MPSTVEEVERTEALLRDAIRLLSEPATSYSRSAAAAVVVESLRLYRQALERQRAARRVGSGKPREAAPAPYTYQWRGSLAELSTAAASPERVPA
jgi:hypothetical protein